MNERLPSSATISRRTALLWCLIWLAWLPMAVPMVASLASSHVPSPRLVLSLFGLVCFLVLYISINWQSSLYLANPDPHAARVAGPRIWGPLALLYALCGLLVVVNGTNVWGGLFFYTVATLAGALPWRQAIGAILAVVALMLLVGHAQGANPSTGLYALVLMGIICATVLGWLWAFNANRKARADHEEIERLAAIAEERLRIARDLHDVLGHSLSLIALKSELAGRLLDAAPERARAEIQDVEQVARQALREVREAVSGYRQATLAEEWASARALLEAAGVALSPESTVDTTAPLPASAEAVLGFALREGVTNIVRHSSARTCTIQVRQETERVTLTVTNDGASSARSGPPTRAEVGATSSGNGLRGLRERVLALGGTWEAGLVGRDGFRMEVGLPLGAGDQPLLVAASEHMERMERAASGASVEGAAPTALGGILPKPAL